MHDVECNGHGHEHKPKEGEECVEPLVAVEHGAGVVRGESVDVHDAARGEALHS